MKIVVGGQIDKEDIAAIVKSIVNKVRYTVEQATNLQVAKVNVFVDSMKTENS